MKLDGPSPPSAAENRKLAGREPSATFAISSSATTNQESLDSSVPDAPSASSGRTVVAEPVIVGFAGSSVASADSTAQSTTALDCPSDQREDLRATSRRARHGRRTHHAPEGPA